MYLKAFTFHRERCMVLGLGIMLQKSWQEKEGAAVSRTQVGVDTFPWSARGSLCCQLGVWSNIEQPVRKGGVRKSEPNCLRKERWKAEHSIRAESEGRGGGLHGASPAGVLGKRGAVFSPQISMVLGNRSGLSGLQSTPGHPHFTDIPPLSLSIPPDATPGAGESCCASVQLTVTGKSIKALDFFFSLVFYKVTS